MIYICRSWLPGGQPWIMARLRCDGCKAWGPGPIGSDCPGHLLMLRARLRIAARACHRWASVRILWPDAEAGRDIPHQVDLCPRCRAAAPKQRPWN